MKEKRNEMKRSEMKCSARPGWDFVFTIDKLALNGIFIKKRKLLCIVGFNKKPPNLIAH